MPRRVAALLVILLVAGCAGGGDAGISEDELSRLVLQPRDLPRSFVRFDTGRQVQLDAPGGVRSDPARFGRVDGWKARYRRPGSPKTRGPLVIESRADLFDDAGGGRDELAAIRDEFRAEAEAAGGHVLTDPAVGDETVAATFVEGDSPRVRFFRVAWREDNAVASLFVNGFDGRINLEHVLELARKQQQRIRAASEG